MRNLRRWSRFATEHSRRSAAIDYIAQNGIQVSFGATAWLGGNAVSGNWYSPKAWLSCGVLFYDAAGVKKQANHVIRNEKNLCNFGGRGGGNFNPAMQ